MAHVGRPFTDYKPTPAAPVWAVIEGLGRYHVLLAALELGVFEALDDAPAGTGMTAHDLAERLGLPERHTEALLDSVVALGLLVRVVDDFMLNDAARRYLLVDGAASMAGLIRVAPAPMRTGSGWPTPCARAGPPLPSTTIRPRSTCRWWRARSPQCGAALPEPIFGCATAL